MIRRSPTRVVLKLDDLQEYESMRKEIEAKKGTPAQTTWDGPTKTKQDIVRERIGYVPQPHDAS
ncbi:anaphase-promoting complex subunit CDC26-like [Thrips palmi]|uniref:Anaphase-promoting complex subunit CDC26 n=1 Tax=Thrips palmi TaxID=161013 RepID=A0A6P8Z3Z4_THRPL|nr:anaphase-promoting complex subunit CDC26-like [Thrips palmi]